MQVGEEYPFAHLVAIEVEPCAVVFSIPLNFAVVGFSKLQGVGSTHIVGREIRFLSAGFVLLGGCAGVPVVAVKRNAERKLFFWNNLERVIEILNGPLPSGDRAGDSPAGVLIVG